MSIRKHLRPGKKWLTIKSSEMTWEKVVKDIYKNQTDMSNRTTEVDLLNEDYGILIT